MNVKNDFKGKILLNYFGVINFRNPTPVSYNPKYQFQTFDSV